MHSAVCSVSYPSLSITSLQSLPDVLTGPEAQGKKATNSHFTSLYNHLHLSSFGATYQVARRVQLGANLESHTHLISCAAAHWTQETGFVIALTAQQSSPAVSSLAVAPSSVTVRSTNIVILFPDLTEVISPSILHALHDIQSRPHMGNRWPAALYVF
jgi:hypothetical protein